LFKKIQGNKIKK